MVPSEFNVLLVYSEQYYNEQVLPRQLGYRSVKMPYGLAFMPPVDMNQIHVSRHKYHPFTGNNTVKLGIYCYSEYRYLIFAGIGKKPHIPDGLQK